MRRDVRDCLSVFALMAAIVTALACGRGGQGCPVNRARDGGTQTGGGSACGSAR